MQRAESRVGLTVVWRVANWGAPKAVLKVVRKAERTVVESVCCSAVVMAGLWVAKMADKMVGSKAVWMAALMDATMADRTAARMAELSAVLRVGKTAVLKVA